MDKYLTVGQVSEMIGVSCETIRRWDKAGKFTSTRHPINNYRVYAIDQVTSLINELQCDYIAHNRHEASTTQEPYLKTDMGELYNTDAVDFLKNIQSESVNLIFADPPYNIKKAEWDTFQSQKDYVEWSMTWIKEAYRVLHPDGTLYICGFSEILADIKWAASHLFKGCKWLVWYYRNKANLGNDWGRSHESILHFRKGKNHIFNTDNVRVSYNAHTLKYPSHPQAETSQYGNGKKYMWMPHPDGAKPKDVFEIPTLSNGSWERTNHPTQKPVELVKKCILASSNCGNIIVDPFGGSGTTFAVAEALGRRWKGCEISQEYCQIIRKRLLDKRHLERIASFRDEVEATERRSKIRG